MRGCHNGRFFDEQVRTPGCINQAALDEARKMVVNESFDLDGKCGHGFKQPDAWINRRVLAGPD